MKKFLSFFLVLVLIFGMAVPSIADEQDFDEWWATAPKIDIERVDISYFDVFKTNGTVETTYENGVLEITINNTSPEIWAKLYNDNSTPSFGEKQESIRGLINFIGVEGTVASCAETTGNAPQYVMNFENSDDKYFRKSGFSKGNIGFATIAVAEDGSAKIIPDSFKDKNMVICMAWKDREGNITYEYIEIVIKVSPEDTIINIPEGKINVAKKIEDKNRITFDESYDYFEGELNKEYSEVIYNYTGSKNSIAEIEAEVAEGNEGDGRYFITYLNAKEGYKITEFEINSDTDESLGQIIEEGESLIIGHLLMFDFSELNTSDLTEVFVYSVSETDPEDVLVEKLYIKPFFNITWMENAGFEAVPEERIEFLGQDAIEKLAQCGVIISSEDGELVVSYKNNIDIEQYNSIEGSFKILPPEGAVTSKFIGSGGDSRDSFYELGAGEGIENDINDSFFGPIEESSFGTKRLKEKNVEDITYYYSGPAQYVAYVIIWEMEDGTTQKEFVKVIYEEYINNVTTEGINSEDLGSAEIKNPTVIKDHFNKGYHGNDWRFTSKYYPQESESGNTYYFELEIKGEGSKNSGELKRVYLPYNFISDDMTYEKAVEEDLDVKVIHYLDEFHTEYEEISGTPDENGIYFDVYTFSPFIINWEYDEQEKPVEPEDPNESEKPSVPITPIKPVIPNFPINIKPSEGKDEIVSDKETEEETNPSTGAPVFENIG